MTPPPKIWVTRPQPDAAQSAAKLASLGYEPIIAPLLEMHALPTRLPGAAGFSAIALTSANALRALIQREALTDYLNLPAFCVGIRTALEASQAGFTNVLSAEGALADLVQLISQQKSEGPIFYPSGQHVEGDLAAALAPHNRLVITSKIYAMRPASQFAPEIIRAVEAGNLAAVTFYSRRTAEIFCALATDPSLADQLRTTRALCLSENVAQPLINNHFTRIGLADYPSEEAMMALALAFKRGHIEPNN